MYSLYTVSNRPEYTFAHSHNTLLHYGLLYNIAAIPEVHVTPRIQSKRPGEDAIMYCHVIGEPFPKVIH